jgi:putative oxidoreductase
MGHFIIQFQEKLYGIVLIYFGLNGFFHFVANPEHQGFAKEFMTSLHHSGYIFPTIASIQVLAGMSLIANQFANIGLLLMLPVSANIFAFHLVHEPGALVIASLLLFLNLFNLVRRSSLSKSQLVIRSRA